MNGISSVNRRMEWDQKLNIKKILSRHLLLCLVRSLFGVPGITGGLRSPNKTSPHNPFRFDA
jgi:hypothetical protein